MSQARILDGKATSALVREEVAACAARLTERGVQPGLAVVLVGDDPASHVYVRNKDRAAQQAGFQVQTVRMPASATQEQVESEVRRLAVDPAVHGILVQLPLPKHLSSAPVIECIPAVKDVDGLSLASVGALALGQPGHRPCTPAGCIEILDRAGIALEGQHVVIVGRSMLVGKPIAQLLLERNATVTICHSRTRNLDEHCKRADILVAAVGVPKLIQGAWLSPHCTVLDVGINRTEEGKLVGDVDFESASAVVSAITPVPGGIGPMTIAMLLVNTMLGAAQSAGLDPGELGWKSNS
ncbi:MAG: bifunctional 5,10-methylenetetrahydrofolate dehydrogenase/5,10-methenyltetrahydrofolate cyclohydrolase [Planctomycetes bacterium]|nr:bifunctional 5,10-methylenetetrahydrofolate dehydrogenase/5,10-methenyltetrahydrofolate cyclohydrolase [Planctomycetota bacterium]